MISSLPPTSLTAAFLAGLLSFVSPCVLPLIPSYLSYLTGLSFDQLTDPADRSYTVRRSLVAHALLFISGFAGVFVAFGASASFLGQLLTDYQQIIRQVGAVLMVLFGLYLLGLVKLRPLMRERRIHFSTRPAGYAGSFLIGATFAAGWTPCVGPILGTILLYAGTTDTLVDGMTLLVFYSAGLGLPFLLVSLGVVRFMSWYRHVRAYLGLVSGVSGGTLVAMGIIMYLDRMPTLTAVFERYGIGSYLGIDGG